MGSVGLALLVAGCSVVGAPSGEAPGPPEVAPPSTRPAARRPGPLPTTPVRTFREVRGLWVVRSTMTSAEEIRTMVERADRAGFNTLLVQIRGRGDAFYRSRWEPRAETVTGSADFDPLALAIEEGHARGMAVHAWVNTHLVWGTGDLPRSPEHLVRAHPDWLAVPRDLGRELYDVEPSEPRFVNALHRYAREHTATVEGIYSSPSHPAVKERVYSVWMDLVERYDVDGIHFDYVRFPSADFDYSRSALERFRAWVEPRLSPDRRRALEAGFRADPYAYVEALPGPWGEFRRAQIDGLVERIYHGVKARRPEVLVSAAVFADRTDAYRSRFQDWPRWLAHGILDVAVPMAYTPDDDRFRELIASGREAAAVRERLWAGIGVYLTTYDGTVSKIDIARRQGAGGVILFSYDWAVSEGEMAGGVSFLERVGREAFGDGR